MLGNRFYKDKTKSQYKRKEIMGGYKEVYHLEQSILEDRFRLESREGVAGEFLIGNIPGDVLSGGFFYTNKNTLSIGTIVHLDTLSKDDKAYEAIEYFKEHPYIKKMLKNAELIEYGSKLVPEMGIKGFPNFYGNGWMVVGDAAGFVFSNGLLIQGMNYAIKSGILAADTYLETRKSEKYSGAQLKLYEKKLKNSYILKDFKNFSKVKTITKNKRMFKVYPYAINDGMRDFFTEDGEEKQHLLKTILKSFKKSGVGIFTLIKDGLNLRHI